MISFSRAVYEVARKEAMQHLRTKRLLVLGGIMLAMFALLTVVLPSLFFPEELLQPADDRWVHNELFGLFVTIPIIGGMAIMRILAITLTADGVSAEWQRRTIFLMLARPVPRSAFVLGKFLGSAIPISILYALVALIDYAAISFVVGALPGASEFRQFIIGLGMMSLGIIAYSSLGLFFSSLTRGTLPSFILSFLVALLVLPAVSAIGFVVYQVDSQENFEAGNFDRSLRPDPREWKYDWSTYLDPGSAMARVGTILQMPDSDGQQPGIGFGPQRTWPAVLSALTWTGLLLGGSLLTVLRRDFD